MKCTNQLDENKKSINQPQKPSKEVIERMPKVDLHVHLEGTIQPTTLIKLATENHIKLEATTTDELRNLFKFSNFDDFVKKYSSIISCIKTPQDYELISYEFGNYCHEQNIRYAEVTFTIETHCMLSGLPWQTILKALNSGRMKAVKDFDVNWQWIFDISRDNYATQHVTFDIVKQAVHDNSGVVALGLTGHENATTPATFAATFDEARDLNIKRTIHAGEFFNSESILAALYLLHANRIGHGVRASENQHLITILRESQIPLEICPTSNICLGIYPSYAQHPLRKLWEAGLFITVNDDDPALFNTSMNHEYEVLVEHFGFTTDMLKQISLNGIKASFLSPIQKKKLEQEFLEEFADNNTNSIPV